MVCVVFGFLIRLIHQQLNLQRLMQQFLVVLIRRARAPL
jgi:cell shape-determining protein MreD